MEPLAEDWLGKTIEVGSEIVYPVRKSSSVWMVKARVESIDWVENPRWWQRDDKPRLPVLVVIRQNESGWGGPILTVKPRRVKVSSLERVTVVG